MSDFHWWSSVDYPADAMVSKDMHSQSLWFALLQTMREQHAHYMRARNIRDVERRRELLLRSLLIGTVSSEFIGKLRCQLVLNPNHENSNEFHDLLHEMEKDFEARYESMMFHSVVRNPVVKKPAKRLLKAARNFR